jgi:hypothetical protein
VLGINDAAGLPMLVIGLGTSVAGPILLGWPDPAPTAVPAGQAEMATSA